jgi:hypothetical protein
MRYCYHVSTAGAALGRARLPLLLSQLSYSERYLWLLNRD